jgi:hypothetical protein
MFPRLSLSFAAGGGSTGSCWACERSCSFSPWVLPSAAEAMSASPPMAGRQTVAGDPAAIVAAAVALAAGGARTAVAEVDPAAEAGVAPARGAVAALPCTTRVSLTQATGARVPMPGRGAPSVPTHSQPRARSASPPPSAFTANTDRLGGLMPATQLCTAKRKTAVGSIRIRVRQGVCRPQAPIVVSVQRTLRPFRAPVQAKDSAASTEKDLTVRAARRAEHGNAFPLQVALVRDHDSARDARPNPLVVVRIRATPVSCARSRAHSGSPMCSTSNAEARRVDVSIL